MNTQVQGTAADLIKLAMVGVHRTLEARRLRARLLLWLQVHDELVFEVSGAELDEVVDPVRKEMGEVMSLAVPLVGDVGTGRTG